MLSNGIYVSASMLKVKVAELDIRARVSSPTNVRSGPQSPESRSRPLPARLALTIYKSTSVVTSASYHISCFPQMLLDTRNCPRISQNVFPELFIFHFIPFHSSFLTVHAVHTTVSSLLHVIFCVVHATSALLSPILRVTLNFSNLT
jgi:hypothetical protein